MARKPRKPIRCKHNLKLCDCESCALPMWMLTSNAAAPIAIAGDANNAADAR